MVFLSSCCWFVKVDCLEGEDPPFTLGINYQHADSILQSTDTLELTVQTANFLNEYQEKNYDYTSFYIDITWFDGNFTSPANDRVDVLYQNVPVLGSTQEGYEGALPDSINMQLAFPIPGYYLIQFYGGANRQEGNDSRRRSRCGCNSNFHYLNWEFDANRDNAVWLPIYEQSFNYSIDTYALEKQGAYFIKVE